MICILHWTNVSVQGLFRGEGGEFFFFFIRMSKHGYM